MKFLYLLICLFGVYAMNAFSQENKVGPVLVGVCPPAKDCPPEPVKPKPAPVKYKKVEKKCPSCPPCEPKVVEKKVEVEVPVYKKNTVSLLLGRGRDGLYYDLDKTNVLIRKGYGVYVGVRYERKLDPSWSVSGEWLTTESANLGLGYSW